MKRQDQSHRFWFGASFVLLVVACLSRSAGQQQVDAFAPSPKRRARHRQHSTPKNQPEHFLLPLKHFPLSKKRLSCKQGRALSLSSFENEEIEVNTEKEQGSVLGAALLFAGTAIGAGMLALPAETAASGYVPSIASLLLCWLFTFVTSLVTLEASWTVSNSDTFNKATSRGDGGSSGGGFISISQETLGPVGEVITALLFWFLLTSIVTAYTSEGGALVSEFAREQLGNDSMLLPSPALGSVLFVSLFAGLDFFGTKGVDLVNRVLVAGLVITFLGLLGIGLPQVDASLLVRADWTAVYPDVISVGILSLGAQNVVPTLLSYLGGDATRTKRAIVLGSLIPLAMYTLWESVFLGIVPYDPTLSASKMEIVSALGQASSGNGNIVQELVEIFSACAIGSSMAGASVSLVDFFQDAMGTLGLFPPAQQESSANEKPLLTKRLLAASLALGPPLGIACFDPDAFLGVLENVGLLGGVSLYGVLPALALVQLRQRSFTQDEPMPGRLFGGLPVIYALIGVSFVLVLSDVVELGGRLQQ